MSNKYGKIFKFAYYHGSANKNNKKHQVLKDVEKQELLDIIDGV